MGTHLTGLLREKGTETLVTSRRPRTGEGTVRYVQGNALDLTFLKTLLQQQWDAIVDFMVYKTDTFSERADLLLQATSQYIFLSSARVYAGSDNPLTEQSSRLLDSCSDKAFLATDEYSLTKARQENILQTSTRTNWTIVRPYITYSENRLQLGPMEKEDWLYRALHGRTIVFSRDICSKTTTLTYGLNVAEGIHALIGAPDALGKAYHITTPQSLKWEHVLDIYLEVLERHLARKPQTLLLELEDFLACQPARYQVIYDRLFDRAFDNSNIARHINTHNFTEPSAGLRHCLEHLIRNPDFTAINWKQEAYKDKRTGEHTPLREISPLKNKIRYLVHRYLPTQ
jgi:nucleoside-diphosphate-sugar epimerase